MQKTEHRCLGVSQASPVSPHCFQQAEGSHDIGIYKFGGAADGPIHMAFRCKIQYGPGLVPCQQRRYQGAVPNVALHKNMVLIVFDGIEIAQITGISQLVQVDHEFVGLGQPVKDKITADKAGAAGHENCHKHLFARIFKLAPSLMA